MGVTLDSSLTFSKRISNLTRPSYFHLRCLGTIHKSVFTLFFPPLLFHLSVLELISATLYSLVSLKFDYLLSKLCSLLPLVSLLISLFSSISSFMTQQLHWLPFTAYIEFKV